jgi:hypothetical protein
MRNQVRGGSIILIVALVSGIVWELLRPKEPVYQGRTLSGWLEVYGTRPNPDSPEWHEANEAVRQIGTNGIPTLLAMLHRSDSAPWKRKFLDLAYKQHLIKFNHIIAWRQNWCAAKAFGALGSNASGAVPELIKLYEHPVSSPSQRYTAMALDLIGPAAKLAVPSLVQSVNTSKEEEVEVAAIFALGGIHSEPKVVMPVLIKSLANTSVEVQKAAIDSLKNFGADAQPAVSALVELLQNPNQEIANHARIALLQIDPATPQKMDVK